MSTLNPTSQPPASSQARLDTEMQPETPPRHSDDAAERVIRDVILQAIAGSSSLEGAAGEVPGGPGAGSRRAPEEAGTVTQAHQDRNAEPREIAASTRPAGDPASAGPSGVHTDRDAGSPSQTEISEFAGGRNGADELDTAERGGIEAGTTPAVMDEVPQGPTGASETAAARDAHPIGSELAVFETKIAKDKARTVNPQMAAQLFNQVRRYGRAHSDGTRAASNEELMSHVTEQVSRQWYAAQGLKSGDVNALRRASFGSGMANPTGTFIMNAANYILAPLAAAYSGTPWANVGVGLASNLLAAPANSLQQSSVVTICEHLRERSGYTVTNSKSSVNDNHWPAELAKTVKDRAEACRNAGDGLSAAVHDLITKHRNSAPREADQETLMRHLLTAATPEERSQIVSLHGAYREAQQKMDEPQRDLFMTQASYRRQEIGNAWQIIPRTLRSPVSTLVGLGSGATAAATVLKTGERIASFVGKTSVGVQAGLALFLYGAQAVMAGLDEANKQDYNNKINLMYGDFLTAAGNEKVRQGNPVEADDIDPGKLRGFIVSSEQATVKRLGGIVSDTLEKQRAALAELKAAGGDQEPIGHLTTIVENLEGEEKLLKSSQLSRLPEHGFVAGLLGGSLDKYFSFLAKDLAKKYTTTEFSAQTAQRVGQNFHFGVFGGTGASMIGKLSSAIVGGAKNAPTSQILGIAGAGAMLGGIGAYFQSSAINIKNHRRANASDPERSYGFLGQVNKGVLGGFHIVQGKREMTQAHAAANEALGHVSMVLEGAETVSNLADLLDNVMWTSGEATSSHSAGVDEPESSGQAAPSQ